MVSGYTLNPFMTEQPNMEKTEAHVRSAHERAEEILTKVRPYVQMHGGDVQLIGIEDGVATLRIYGACVGCSLADMTYNTMIGGLLKEEIPEIKKVVLES